MASSLQWYGTQSSFHVHCLEWAAQKRMNPLSALACQKKDITVIGRDRFITLINFNRFGAKA